MLTIANTVHKQSLSCWLFLKCELLDETGKKPRLLEPIGTLFSILKDISALSIGKHSIDCLSFLSIIKIYPFSKNIYIYIYSYDLLFLDETYHSGKFWCFLGGWRYIKIASIDIDAFAEKNQKYLEENIIRTFICCNHLIYLLKSSM